MKGQSFVTARLLAGRPPIHSYSSIHSYSYLTRCQEPLPKRGRPSLGVLERALLPCEEGLRCAPPPLLLFLRTADHCLPLAARSRSLDCGGSRNLVASAQASAGGKQCTAGHVW